MDEPDLILQKILDFERTYTPHFNNLIKQSEIEHVDIEDDPINDIYPQLPDPPPPPPQRKSASDSDIVFINDHLHSIESLLSSSTQIKRRKPMHQHKETPIMARAGTNPNPIKVFDPNSFILSDEIQYESDEDENNRYSSDEEDEFEEEPQHPLIEEYDEISHEIHVSKIRLRKLDRQISMAGRMNESQSDFVKKHSTIKIKIAQLISKRRQLETHDIIKEHLKDEDVDTVEIDVRGTEMMDLNDDNVIAINEEEEEEDPEDEEEKEIINNDGNVDEEALNGFLPNLNGSNGYNDDRSRSTMNDHDFDYSYDAEVVVKEDDDEERIETGSIKYHSSDSDEIGAGGSVEIHSEEDDDDIGGGSVELHSTEEDDRGSMEVHSTEDDDRGSVEVHSTEDDDDDRGSVEVHSTEEDEEDDLGSVEVHSTEEEEDEGGGSVRLYHSENEYEDDDDDDDDGGGSVQMNDEIEQNEEWVDEEFDTKSIEIYDSENEKDDDNDDIKEVLNENEDHMNHLIPNDNEHEIDSRSKRLEQMKRRKSYKDYGDEDDTEQHHDLDALKSKYRDDRRNREQLSEIETPFSMNDLLKTGDDDGDDTKDALVAFRENMDDIKDNNDDLYGMNDNEDGSDDDDLPQFPERKRSVLLDINILSAKLADIVEEEWSEDESEGRFHAVEYETDSDADSNDSIVVKKEIVKNVTVNELQKTDSV